MRRKDRAISEEEAVDLLNRAEYGVLATAGADGAPYTVPLSYVFMEGKVYFHCARNGRKIDNLKAESRVSFVVVGDTEVVYDGGFGTYYKSAQLNGRARLVEEPEEWQASLRALAQKYLPAHLDKVDAYIKRYDKQTLVYAVEGGITGKARKKV